MNDTSNLPPTERELGLLEASSPYFILVDSTLRIARVGRSMRKLAGPGLVLPTPFGDVFRVVQPQVAHDLEALSALEGSPITLECLSMRVVLRASVVAWEGGVLFLASPWIASRDDLDRLGLGAADFAPHDPLHDLMSVFDRKLDVVSRLQRANEQLESMRAELESSKRAVVESHATALAVLGDTGRGLRTPLSSLTGAIALLLSTGLDAAQLELAAALRTATRQLTQLVEDAVDFAELDAAAGPAQSGVVSTHRVVDDALELVADDAARKELDFAGLVEGDVPELLHADPKRMRQVIVNLLRGAVAHTDAGRVSLFVRMSGGQVCFVIEETSGAARAASMSELLGPGAAEPARALGLLPSAGLGLLLAQKAARLLDAELRVESLGKEGSRLVLTLSDEASRRTPTSSQETLEARSLPLHGRRVLVYDESSVAAQSNASRLARLGAAVQRAESVPDLLRLAERHIVDASLVGTFRGVDSARRLVDELTELPGLFVSASRGFTHPDPDIVPLPRPLRFAQLSRLFHEQSSSATPARPFLSVAALTVLVVEDELLNQRILGLLLERRGVLPTVVASGRAAIEAVEAGDFDLVLMDLQLPDLDGLEAMRAIRQSHLFRPMIVAVTASAGESARQACMAAGADDVIVKPYDEKSLSQVLARAARRPRVG